MNLTTFVYIYIEMLTFNLTGCFRGTDIVQQKNIECEYDDTDQKGSMSWSWLYICM